MAEPFFCAPGRVCYPKTQQNHTKNMSSSTSSSSEVTDQQAAKAGGKKHARWLPLESNPDVMNEVSKEYMEPTIWWNNYFYLTFVFMMYLQALGVKDIPSKWQICDVLGVDPTLLAMVPQPVAALLFLFPISDNYEKFAKELVEKMSGKAVDPSMYFMKQTVGNACGTIGLIHAIANKRNIITLDAEKALDKFLERTKAMSPSEKADALCEDDGITSAHESMALLGQTDAPDRDEKVNLHFIAFVENNGRLMELDGRKPIQIDHGPTNNTSFLQDAAEVCKEYMKRDPDEMRFTLHALARPDN